MTLLTAVGIGLPVGRFMSRVRRLPPLDRPPEGGEGFSLALVGDLGACGHAFPPTKVSCAVNLLKVDKEGNPY